MSAPMVPLHDAVRAFKADYIRQAIVAEGGHRTRAAQRLGLERTYLRRLIVELGIDDLPTTHEHATSRAAVSA